MNKEVIDLTSEEWGRFNRLGLLTKDINSAITLLKGETVYLRHRIPVEGRLYSFRIAKIVSRTGVYRKSSAGGYYRVQFEHVVKS